MATIKTVQEWVLGVGAGRLEAGTQSPVGNAHTNQSCKDSPRSEVGGKGILSHQKIVQHVLTTLSI